MAAMTERRENELDLPSAQFEPRRFGLGAWTGHLHFACDLVATVRPRVLVELGADRGESYFAFCQAAAEHGTGTRCFAVDTWRGDEHSGGYDETTFAEVSAHNRAHYASFSTLLRRTFTEALPHFAPESIDVLHLDGLHTEAAVRADLTAWLPKLVPGGILLMHDVAVRARGFGVWKGWEEMRGRGRNHTFAEGPGLGVWEKPPAKSWPFPLEKLLAGAGPARDDLAHYYRGRAEDLQGTIWQAWQDGTVRETAIALQTTIQLFHSRDGVHSEENSISARVGHGAWKEVRLTLPEGAGAVPLRLDFYSALTVIDIGLLEVSDAAGVLYSAGSPANFDRIRIAGDAERLPHPQSLRVRVTGVDPQLYLPPLETAPTGGLTCKLRLRVNASEAPG